MPFANTHGFSLHYSLEGPSSYPTVVLSNSLGADLSMWNGQMDALLAHFRVLRYDTRGHGQSQIPDGPCTLANLGGDLIALLDVLGIRQAQLCGVSLGGMTAMWVGLHAPQRITSLVLSHTSARIGTADSWKERIEKVEAKGLSSIADAVVARWFTPTFQEHRTNFTVQKEMLLGCSRAGYLAASGALRDSDLRPEIHTLTMPTLVISGANDVVTPTSDGRSLENGISGAIFRQVPGAHLSNIEEPEAYNAVLLPFLLHYATSEAKQ